MKSLSVILLVFLCCCKSRAQNPNNWDTAWVSSFGGANMDYGKDLKETPDKGLILVGTTGSFGDGKTSFYLIKTDSLGHYKWSKAIGSSENDLAASVELADDGGYFITGSTNCILNKGYDFYLIKTDANGKVQWSKNYGSSDWDFVYQSCKMPDGGLVLCGETYSGIYGDTQALLIRVNAQGDELWRKEFGGSGNDVFNVIKYHSGFLYAAGKSFDTTTKFNKASLYKLDVNGNTKLQNVFGGTNTENMEYKDLFISRSGYVWLGGFRGKDTSARCILRQLDTLAFNQVYYMTNSVKMSFNSVLEGRNAEVYALATTLGNIAAIGPICLRYDSVFTQLTYDFYDGKNDEEGVRMIKTSKGYAFVGYTTTFGNTNTKEKNVFLVVLNKPYMTDHHFQIINEYTDLLSPVYLNHYAHFEKEISIFPNPLADQLLVRIPSGTKEAEVILKNAIGQIVLKEKSVIYPGTELEWNIQNLQKGTYLLELYLDNVLVQITKLIK